MVKTDRKVASSKAQHSFPSSGRRHRNLEPLLQQHGLAPPADLHEFADVTSNSHSGRTLYRACALYGAFAIADKFAASFKDFPPSRSPNTIDQALAMMSKASAQD